MVKNRSKSINFNQKLVNFNQKLTSSFNRNLILKSDFESDQFRGLNSDCLKSELTTNQFVGRNCLSLSAPLKISCFFCVSDITRARLAFQLNKNIFELDPNAFIARALILDKMHYSRVPIERDAMWYRGIKQVHMGLEIKLL